MFEHLAFRPINVCGNTLRDRIVARIQASNLLYWATYLGAKVFRTLLQGGQADDFRAYSRWFEQLGRLCLTSSNDNILDDLASRLSGALEVRALILVVIFPNPKTLFLKSYRT